MAYHKILIRQIPRVMFAHGFKTDRYDIRFAPVERMMELSFLEQGDVVKTDGEGRQTLIPAPSLAVSFRDRAFSMKSEAPIHSHFTVGFLMDFERRPITKEQIVLCDREPCKQGPSHFLTAILPDHCELDQQNSNIEKRIKQIIHAHASPGNTGDIRCAGLLFDLLAEITGQCARDAMADSRSELSPGGILYVQRAIQYISEHLEKKITVEEIAAYLKISGGYLSNLFGSMTGQTVIGYVNRVKLERVKEMIANKPVTLKEAGESVGIYDENYLSRIFKKYTGLTVREYRALKTF